MIVENLLPVPHFVCSNFQQPYQHIITVDSSVAAPSSIKIIFLSTFFFSVTRATAGTSKGTVESGRDTNFRKLLLRNEPTPTPFQGGKIAAPTYGHTYSKSMDQPGKVANPARGQLNREK